MHTWEYARVKKSPVLSALILRTISPSHNLNCNLKEMFIPLHKEISVFSSVVADKKDAKR